MTLTLHHAVKTRSFVGLWMLEELGRPYEIHLLDMEKAEHKADPHMALNGLGKVPVVVDDGVPISERAAICCYLADKYAMGTLAPAFDSPHRAAYLRWLFYSVGVLEPAYCEHFFDWKESSSRLAWGSLADAMATARAAVDATEYLAGDQFTAADVMMGSTLRWGVLFGIEPNEGPIAAYVERCTSRPAFKRATAKEAELGGG